MAALKPIRSKSAISKSASAKPTSSKPAPAAEPKRESSKPVTPVADAKGPAPAKRKQKLIRDSFTIPKDEYLVLEQLKQRALRSGHAAKKSEILRAGIAALNGMSDSVLLAALSAVPSLKTGRPKDTKPKQAKSKDAKPASKKS
jgi:hypothetical protein